MKIKKSLRSKVNVVKNDQDASIGSWKDKKEEASYKLASTASYKVIKYILWEIYHSFLNKTH